MSGTIKKNFAIVFGSQALILLVSVARALILPKMFSVEDFGYWEVYWFYSTYCGLFCLGFNDGVYLKYGEFNYDQLPMKTIRSSTRLFVWMLILFSVLCELLIIGFSNNPKIKFSLSLVTFNILIVGVYTLYIYIFQITNQFKRYGVFSVFDKIFVLAVILSLLLANGHNYRYVVAADFISKIIALLFMIWKAKEILFGEVFSIKESFRDFYDNMKVGIKLMIANLMGMLIMGAGKLVAQLFGNIEDFAIYSFGISMTGLVLTAVTAFSLVLYPAIKRIDLSRYANLFNQIDGFTRLFGITSLLLYFPCVIFVKAFYPSYSPVLVYLNLLFIIVFLQCKINILNNTFFKVLRKERELLIANMLCILIFVVLVTVLYLIYKEIVVIPTCTAISMCLLYFYSKRYLYRLVDVEDKKNTIIEFLFILVFVLATMFFTLLIGTVLMLVIYLIWFAINYKTNLSIIRGALKI